MAVVQEPGAGFGISSSSDGSSLLAWLSTSLGSFASDQLSRAVQSTSP